MPTRKTAKKPSKATTKRRGTIVLLYGPPIYDAIRRGNTAEMKKLAAQARKHISEVQTALAALDKKIASS